MAGPGRRQQSSMAGWSKALAGRQVHSGNRGAAAAEERAANPGRTSRHAGDRWRAAGPDCHPKRDGGDSGARATSTAEAPRLGGLERARSDGRDEAEPARSGFESRKVRVL